jgi:hypothetical protein
MMKQGGAVEHNSGFHVLTKISLCITHLVVFRSPFAVPIILEDPSRLGQMAQLERNPGCKIYM